MEIGERKTVTHSTSSSDSDTPAPVEERRLATWGTEVPDDLGLDQQKLAEALKKENEKRREERAEGKSKYNVKYNDDAGSWHYSVNDHI
ncbi:hypothetical protein K7X08_035144 [Anisodus acutangulus]|uniref:Pre-mRNA-splicing factor SLU7 n=1 Tax=Anisodus acutangulus TaxID=402998 RepID=A0A9Q1LGT9_9SOLA|nr:hypothetical protein K7X08_035144 [Anisodus acutangulus]